MEDEILAGDKVGVATASFASGDGGDGSDGEFRGLLDESCRSLQFCLGLTFFISLGEKGKIA